MRRVTMSFDDGLLAELDAFLQKSGAASRSEALRDLVRRGLGQVALDGKATGDCVGVVSYACHQSMRGLARRLAESRHDLHDRTIATTTAPLDHDTAIEVTIMRGDARELHGHAESLFLERGVMHGNVSLIPVEPQRDTHAHGPGRPRAHLHLKVRESF
jgi:CopG family nickel-responsive transcriptional regulator